MNNYSNDGQDDESNQHKKQRQDDEMISINMNLKWNFCRKWLLSILDNFILVSFNKILLLL